MRRITMMQAQWQPEEQAGESLTFEQCKGGCFSTDERYGLRVTGVVAQESRTGKNLLDPDAVGAITFTDSSGNTVTRFGVTVDRAGTLSYRSTAAAGSQYIYICLLENGVQVGANRYLVVADKSYTGNVTVADGQQLLIYNALGSGQTQAGTAAALRTHEAQIEVGSLPTAYEPYCGGIPAPSPASPKPLRRVKAGTVIRCRGRNLLSIKDIVPPADGIPDDTTDYACRLASTVTVSVQNAAASYTSSVWRASVTYQSGRVAYIYDARILDRASFVFEADESDPIIKLQTRNIRMSGGAYTNWQVEYGSTASAYEPYVEPQEITTPCDLCEGDIWYPASGRVERHMRRRNLFQTDAWTMYDAQTGRAGVTIDDMKRCSLNSQAGHCSHAPLGDQSRWSQKQLSCYFGVGNTIFYLMLGYPATLEEFKAAIGARVEIVYPLATPTIESYTPQPLPAHPGTVVLEQVPVEATGSLGATMWVRRM